MPGRIAHLLDPIAAARAAGGAVLLALAFSVLPGSADARPQCGGRKATIVGNGSSNVIKAPKKGVQVIVAGAGDDVIVAKRNKDIVCGGLGNDRIYGGTGRDKLFGGPGDDLIDSGPGSDKVWAEDGGDVVLGGGGGDRVQAGSGNDRIYGGIQDDQLYGDAGNDLISGEHGIDTMGGGDGNDWLRGDVNRDSYFGDAGADTASFAAATPPGPLPTLDGVSVNLATGVASGDESLERLYGIENVVGSAFDDILIGAGGGAAQGGGGGDLCKGFIQVVCQLLPQGRASGPPPVTAYIADPLSPEPGVVILGTGRADAATVSVVGSSVLISGSSIQTGPGCRASSAGITCPLPANPLGYILFWGAGGDDSFAVGGGVPETTMIKADGGYGNDVLSGSPSADILSAGEGGSDRLQGGRGDDALVGRGFGGDVLSGGGGNDNLVSDNPCDGHSYQGGPGGADVAGFGHVTIGGVKAKRGGSAVLRGGGRCSPTTIRGSEVIEGTRFADTLIGTKHFDLLIGREGNDLLIGNGGRDDFRGDAGRDRCLGKGRKQSC